MELKLLSLALALLRVAVATSEPEQALEQLVEADLVARQLAPATVTSASSTSTHASVRTGVTLVTSTTANTISSSSISGSSATLLSNATTSSIPANVTLTGAFSANGGIYDVTVVSGTAVIAGHSLYVGGPDAFVGGVVVTEASNGFIANGTPVPLKTASVSSTTPTPTSTTSTASNGAANSAITTSTSTHPGAAAKTAVPALGAAAAMILGAMAL